MCGDLKATQKLATKMIEGAQKHGLGMWQVYGLAFQGWVAVKRGVTAKGARLLHAALNDFRETRVELRYTIFIEALAETLARSGRVDEATAIVDDALQGTNANEGHWCLPELLRIRAELVLAAAHGDAAEAAEEMLQQALALTRRQGTRAWELRVATSLARLWRKQSRHADACHLLLPIYEGFTEGFHTADLKMAKALIDSRQ
jgi:predicted ATPase